MPSLDRRLTTTDAVVVGLGAMIGAGVFAAFAPAAATAGAWLPLALVVAGVVAYCNAVSSARLAARYPSSGGTYVYGRERLGDLWGFLAGWGFVVGKTASCAAMALTFATYAVPGSQALGAEIGKVFAQDCNIALLENHGVCIGAADMFTAFQQFETLNYSAELEDFILAPIIARWENAANVFKAAQRGEN